eukprot:349764-Rhodomonas_salina.1
MLTNASARSQISSAPACDDVEESNARSAEPWPLRVELSNGRVYGCDYVVSAIGVLPNSVSGL